MNPIKRNPRLGSDKKYILGGTLPCRMAGASPNGKAGVPGAQTIYFWQVIRLESENCPQEASWVIACLLRRKKEGKRIEWSSTSNIERMDEI